MSASRILIELVVVLGTAAVVTIAFQALRLPVVLGYVLAGLVISPHIPVPLVADASLVHVLSELGVILLMFTIGLELPLASIARVGLPGALTALFEVALVVAVGTLVARLSGFAAGEAIFAGACLGISSTMLVAKAFDELGEKGAFTEVVYAILVFEDLIAIVLLAVLTGVATGAGLDAGALAMLVGRLIGFLALMLVGGLLIVPRAMRWIAARARRETATITGLAVCFGMAALADGAGYSVALGAFLAGVLIAESGHGERVLGAVEPFRDVFAMVFFVSVGMSIDPADLVAEAPRIAAFTAVVLVTKPLGVAIATFLAGRGVRSAVRAGLTLAQIGELSFVIAGIAGGPLLAIAVGVSCTTTAASALVVPRSDRIATWAAGRLPGRVATFVSFYEGWLERLRTRAPSMRGAIRRATLIVIVDGAVILAIVIALASHGRAAALRLGLTGAPATGALLGAAALGAAPFAVSLIRQVGRIARRLALEIVPASDAVDLGRAPRRALAVTLAAAIALAIVVPLVAIAQPFVPASFALLLLFVPVLFVALGRSIADFASHVRAGSELVSELLVEPGADPQVAQVATILPGFGALTTITLADGAPAVGRTLAALDLRARTGATVLALRRGPRGLASPSPTEPLVAGDVLALTGSDAAIVAARAVLLGAATA